MANNCNVLMKEAFDNYLGIDMRYKLDDTLAALGKQKLNAAQLEGYLLKQGVSPKEIKQAGILENFRGDSRAFSGEDWLSMSGNQRLSTSTLKGGKYGSAQFADISLDRKGSDNETYKEVLTGVASPRDNIPREPHFSNQLPAIPNNKEVLAKEAVDKYIAKEKDSGRTLIDIFKDAEYKKLYSELKAMELTPSKPQSLLGWRRTHVQEIEGKPALVLNEFQSDWAQTERAGRGMFESNYIEEYSPAVQDLIKAEGLTKEELADTAYMRDKIDNWLEEEFITEAEAKVSNKTKVADFPMSEIKHHQFQIVGAIDDALKQGIDTIAIPIQRENELHGTPGVTKFYESLNQKVLPDIRKKLEKQGLKIRVDKKPYKGGNQPISKYITSLSTNDNPNVLRKDFYNLLEDWEELDLNSVPNYPLDGSLNEIVYNASDNQIYNLSKTISEWLNSNYESATTNELWKLTVEEIPNKPVKWDVYGLIGALGLSSMLAGEANAEELKPSQVSISPKTNQQTQQQPQPIMEQMTTQPEVIEQPRQQMDEGFSLRKLLESDKLAPEVDEQSTASLFEQLGLVKKDELGNYRVNKDIDEDSRVDMRKQMPKTIQDQEGEYLTTHRPTKKSGWTIGRGYDSTGRKLQDIINDFAKAGISQQKAIAFFKHKPISINSKQSKALGDIAWQEKVKVAKSIGLPMEKLDKEGFLKVMSLVYRGDIVKGGDGYRGRLYNYAKNGNIKAIDRFIKTEARNMEGGSVLYNRWKKFDKEI